MNTSNDNQIGDKKFFATMVSGSQTARAKVDLGNMLKLGNCDSLNQNLGKHNVTLAPLRNDSIPIPSLTKSSCNLMDLASPIT